MIYSGGVSRAAAAENSLATFLVECTEEGPGKEVRLVDVTTAYNRWAGFKMANKLGEHPYISHESMRSYILKAGFKLEACWTYPVPGATDARLVKRAIVRELALTEAAPTTDPPTAYERMMADVKAREQEQAAVSATVSAHVLVDGKVYARRAIETVRPIRGFMAGATMRKYIVTFRSGEHRPVYLTEAAGKELTEQLAGRD